MEQFTQNGIWTGGRQHPFRLLSILAIIFGFIAFPHSLVAQETGKIAGVLVDADNGDPLIGANVTLEGALMGASTDIDGSFIILNVPVGTYTVVVQYVGYADTRITGVAVDAEKATSLEVAVRPQLISADEVVVEARLLENTQASLLKKRQRAEAVSDAVSSEQFSRTGSGDAAEAVKQVVGASVVDGKYVYVRGLGDRYSNTQLNGVELPSSDPDKKAFQMDLLPTNLLDNITTIKTFTPDRPGNFSGGIVDVNTKSFPENRTFKVSYSTSYNSQVHFDDNYLTYDGGERDWLAYDDGTRELPGIISGGDITTDELPNSRTDVRSDIASNGDLEGTALASNRLGKAFSSTMDVSRSSVPTNQSFSLAYGDQNQLGGTSSIGYSATLTYGRSFSNYANGEVGIYRLNDGASELNPQLLVRDDQGTAEANIGGLAAFTYNISSTQQVGGNVFYSRSGTSTARFQEGIWPQELDESRIISNRILTYLERDVLSYQLRGKHNFTGLMNSNLEWTASRSSTSQNEPDRRLVFSFADTSRTPTSYTIVGSNFDNPSRYFRELEDTGDNFAVNLEIPVPVWAGQSSKFKTGWAFGEKDRDFSERIFTYLPDNNLFNALGGDVNALFQPENFDYFIDSARFGRPVVGNVITDNSKLRNNYTGSEIVRAYYAMLDLPLHRSLRLIGGVRWESTDMTVVSDDSTLVQGNINKDDALPSLNLVYYVTENMNLRLAGTRTLARPNFREIAPYANKEFVNGFEITGNPELNRTLIDNYDLRWEFFPKPGEIFAISGFYKKMKNPIERTFVSGTTESNRIVSWVNVPEATILGAEFEARIGLSFLSEKLSNFSLGGNFSLVDSEIDIAEEELDNRRAIDSTASATRELQGQSPYIFNVDLGYANYERGTNATLYFNTFGERLSTVSRGATPDIFEQPKPQLDFLVSQKAWTSLTFKFGIKNILDSAFEEVYDFRAGDDATAYKYKKGVTYTFGLTYDM